MLNKALALWSTLSVVLLAVGCGSGGSTLRRFSGDGVSFAYPATWHARTYEATSSFSTSVVYLSPQRLHPPCITRHLTYNTTITCHQPVGRLQPGSMLASWSTQTWPGWTFTRAQGTLLPVGGRPAKVNVTHESCGVGADELMEVVIAIPGSAQTDGWYQLDACISGPGTSARERQVRELLRTVRFTA
ncbi:hypothetical protein AYO39_02385 [Actinobacteria bacterium SCGC AG-212-D09]|nr:hypothetical protein AYO39_02385 [Actinobacteria bacterium SCGC AG-212-D09]